MSASKLEKSINNLEKRLKEEGQHGFTRLAAKYSMASWWISMVDLAILG